MDTSLSADTVDKVLPKQKLIDLWHSRTALAEFQCACDVLQILKVSMKCVCGCCGGTIVGAGCHSAGCHMENGNKFTARARYVYAVVVEALLWVQVVAVLAVTGEKEQVYCQGKVCVCGCCGGTIVGAGCRSAGCHMENRRSLLPGQGMCMWLLWRHYCGCRLSQCWLSHGEQKKFTARARYVYVVVVEALLWVLVVTVWLSQEKRNKFTARARYVYVVVVETPLWVLVVTVWLSQEKRNKFTARARYVYVVVVEALLWVQVVAVLAVTGEKEQVYCQGKVCVYGCCGGTIVGAGCRSAGCHMENRRSLLPGQGVCMWLLWRHHYGCRLSQCWLSQEKRNKFTARARYVYAVVVEALLWVQVVAVLAVTGEKEQVYCQGKVCVCGCCGGTIVGAGCRSAGCHMENRRSLLPGQGMCMWLLWRHYCGCRLSQCWLSHGERKKFTARARYFVNLL